MYVPYIFAPDLNMFILFGIAVLIIYIAFHNFRSESVEYAVFLAIKNTHLNYKLLVK